MTSHRHRAARAGTNQIMDLSHWLASPNSHILIGCKSCRWNRIELLGCAARTLCRDAFRERSVLQGKPKCSTHRNIELLYPYSQRFIGGDILGISEHWGGLVPPNVYGRYAYALTRSGVISIKKMLCATARSIMYTVAPQPSISKPFRRMSPW